MNAPVLYHYQPELETRLETDASDGVVAGVLTQQHGKDWHPVAFYSKSMSDAERNYEIHDKEMLAIIQALQEWWAELEGLQTKEQFQVLTDHQSLEYFMTTKKLNAQQARWAEFLSHFYFLIKYWPGQQNTLTDTLSRPLRRQDSTDSDHQMQILLKPEQVERNYFIHGWKMANNTEPSANIEPLESDLHIVDQILQANQNSKSSRELQNQAQDDREDNWKLEDDLLLWKDRLFVPDDNPELQTQLLDEVHSQVSTAHPGQTKTQQLIKNHYYWPMWRKDVEWYVWNCTKCQQAKNPQDKTPGLLKLLPIPEQPWQHISMDFQSFPKDKKGYNAAFVVVDWFSKRPVSIPCYKTTDTAEMAQLFVEHVYQHWGPPTTIVLDRGPQFISDFWSEFRKTLGIQLKLSTAHHGQTDGQT